MKMTKTTSAGVFQLPNGMWGFRYAFMLNGKQKDISATRTRMEIHLKQREQLSRHEKPPLFKFRRNCFSHPSL